MRRRAAEHIQGLREWAGDEVADDAIGEAADDLTHYMRAVTRLRAELASAHRRIEHLRRRVAYFRELATGFKDARGRRT